MIFLVEKLANCFGGPFATPYTAKIVRLMVSGLAMLPSKMPNGANIHGCDVVSVRRGERVRGCLPGHIESITGRQRRQMGNDIIPLFLAPHSEPLAPFLGGFQTPAPMRGLKGRIPLMFVIGKTNLRSVREAWPETVLAAVRMPDRIRSHELRRFKHQVLIFFERWVIGMIAVTQFRIGDRMRLHDYEKRSKRLPASAMSSGNAWRYQQVSLTRLAQIPREDDDA